MTCCERSILLTLFCLPQFLLVKGQSVPPSSYSITNYNSDNALPQNSINDMAFDHNGFLWLETQMGIVRFDGRDFREYNRENSPALFTDRTTLLSRTKTPGELVFQPSFGVNRYLKVTDDYRLREDSILSANPYQCCRNKHVFSYARLYRKWASRDTGVFDGLFNGLSVNVDVVTVDENRAYVENAQHYYYLDENTSAVRCLSEIAGHVPKAELIIGDVYVLIDRQNHIYAYKGGLPRKLTGSPRLMAVLAGTDITGPYPIQASLEAIRDSNTTFLVNKGDILRVNIKNDVLDFETLAANTPIRNVNCLLYDEKNKIIYAGTATSGLYILKKQEFRRLFFSSDNYVINSLYAQVDLSGGNILTASGILNPTNKVNITSQGCYDRPALLRSSDGHIWYSSYGWLKRTDTSLRLSENI